MKGRLFHRTTDSVTPGKRHTVYVFWPDDMGPDGFATDGMFPRSAWGCEHVDVEPRGKQKPDGSYQWSETR